MAGITDYKIDPGDIDNAKVEGRDATLKGSVADNQAVFDDYPELIKDHFNDLVDFLSDEGTSFPVKGVVMKTEDVAPTEPEGSSWVKLDGLTMTLTRHGTTPPTTKTLYFFERIE